MTALATPREADGRCRAAPPPRGFKERARFSSAAASAAASAQFPLHALVRGAGHVKEVADVVLGRAGQHAVAQVHDVPHAQGARRLPGDVGAWVYGTHTV